MYASIEQAWGAPWEPLKPVPLYPQQQEPAHAQMLSLPELKAQIQWYAARGIDVSAVVVPKQPKKKRRRRGLFHLNLSDDDVLIALLALSLMVLVTM